MRHAEFGQVMRMVTEEVYLSTGAWTDDLDEVVERATRINYW